MILLLLVAGVVAGCRSAKRIIPSTPVIVTNTDSVRTEYIETVRIDTVTVSVQVPMESAMQIVRDSTSHLETKFAESDAWINNDGSLGHSLRNKQQELEGQALIPVKSVESSNEKNSVREVPVPYPEPYYVEKPLTAWQKFRLGAFWYLAGTVLGLLVFILRKPLTTVYWKCFSVK